MLSVYNLVSVENCPEYLLFMENILRGLKWSTNNIIILSNFCKIHGVMEKWGNSFRNVPWNLRFTQIFYLVLRVVVVVAFCNYNNISYTDSGGVMCVSCSVPSCEDIIVITEESRAAHCDTTDGYWWSGHLTSLLL